MNFRNSIQAVAVLGALSLGVPSLKAGQVFYTDFEAGVPSEFTGAGAAEGTQGFGIAVPGMGTQFLRNSSANPALSSTLTLTNLPVHSLLGVNFLLAILDQWDGMTFGDTFTVTVDGIPVFVQTYTNYAPDEAYGGTRLAFNCLCGFNAMSDSGYAVSLTIPHASSTAEISFFASGAQYGADDNSWAIDNVDVLTSIPEPGTVGLFFSGLLGLAMLRRRR